MNINVQINNSKLQIEIQTDERRKKKEAQLTLQR